MHALWISWYPHRRTSGLCAEWNIPLQIVASQRTGPRQRIEQFLKTLGLFHQHRPEILFVQNPSLGLTALAALTKRIFRFYLVVDAHNEGVRPFIRSGVFAQWLTRHLLKAADSTIVTNGALAKDVSAAGGRPLILPDRLPVPPEVEPRWETLKASAPRIVVISTFAPDEPIRAVVEAASKMQDVEFVLSGNSTKFRALRIQLPQNVQLTGFLPDEAYWELLAQADVVCDLTMMPDCLVCGAYEGLAVARPMVLTDNPPTRELFGATAILTTNDVNDIAKAVRKALEQKDSLAMAARHARDAFKVRWHAQAAATWSTICNAAANKFRKYGT